MTPCFVDTYFFLALLRADSAGHDRALEENRVNRKMFTTWFVLLELADHLCDQKNRHLFSMILRAIEADNRFEVIAVDSDLLLRGLELYSTRPDKNWSLTDCTSFVVMADRAITDALTGDRHFVQAGLRALLAPSF